MPALDLVFFDLDDTLYSHGNGVWQAISSRIDRFLMEKLELDAPAARQLRQRYYRRYGTTLTGLMTDYQLAPAEYLEFVHDIPIEQLLTPEHGVADALSRLPQRKLVFTNASRAHARRVLETLNLAGLFERIIAIEDLDYRNKPALVAYTSALELARQKDPTRAMLIDDRLENLHPAQALGMQIRWVHPSDPPPEAAAFHHRSLSECLQNLVEQLAAESA